MKTPKQRLDRMARSAVSRRFQIGRQYFDERGTEQFRALREAGFQFYYMPNG